MKSKFTFLLFVLITTVSYSQSENDKIIYLDSTNMVTTSNNYKYYRIIKDYKLDKESYTILDYYKSGALQMEGTSQNKEGFSKEGEITYYYENGKKKSVTNFVKGRVNGKDFEWYDNGNKKLEGVYIEDEKKRTAQHKIDQFWDINGVQKITDGNGFFEDQGESESSKGEIKNGFKEGLWEGTFKKHKNSYKETYKNGKLISGISTDKNGETYKYTEEEIAPNPKNGIMDFYKFIAKNYKTPENPGLKGKVYITFVVDKEGKIVEPKVLRDIGYGTGDEAIRVVTAYDGFAPGQQRGQKVRCTFSLPISIQSVR
jgi:antitoxin component YwqK of YwqJK toxin-antitoxin module